MNSRGGCDGIGPGLTCPQPNKSLKSLHNSWPAETRDCQQDKEFDGDEKKLDSEGQPKSSPGQYHFALASFPLLFLRLWR